MRTILRSLPILTLVALAGCGSGNGPVPCHPVSGQVTYDGQPAAGVKVYLMPTSAPIVPQIPANPRAVTGADGRFNISTYREGDGAPEGGYQVILYWPPPPSEDRREEDEVDRLLGWYDPAHTTLTVHVKEGTNEMPVIRIPARTQPPRPAEGIPGRN
jgi:hypothetical protein